MARRVICRTFHPMLLDPRTNCWLLFLCVSESPNNSKLPRTKTSRLSLFYSSSSVRETPVLHVILFVNSETFPVSPSFACAGFSRTPTPVGRNKSLKKKKKKEKKKKKKKQNEKEKEKKENQKGKKGIPNVMITNNPPGPELDLPLKKHLEKNYIPRPILDFLKRDNKKIKSSHINHIIT